MITPAFSPKRMYDPSSRRVSFLDHDGPHYLTLFDGAAGRGLLDGGHDHIPYARRAPLAAAEHADGQDAPGPRVIRDP
jgi:hypothetical protein